MNKVLVSAIKKDYLIDYSKMMGLSIYTVRSKKGTLNRFIRWMFGKPFSLQSCHEWVQWLHEKGLKPESIKHEVRVIRATIRFLYKREFIEKDFATEIPYPRVGKKPMYIVSAEKAQEIINAGTEVGPGDNSINADRKKEYRQALRFIVRTGLRSRELIDLRGSDVNIEEESFTVNSKSGDIDILPLPRDLINELKQRVDNERLFEVRPETLNGCLKRGSKRIGVSIRVRTHTLRHIFCTSMLKKGVPIQIVSRLMRHASIAITDRIYSHYVIDDLRLSLNSKHPLIRNGLTPGEFFETIKNVIKGTGIFEDKRFEISTNTNQNRMVISVQTI